MRIVIEVKRDAIARVVLNSLYQHTSMQATFGINNLAIVAGQPKLLNLKDLIQSFIDHRRDVVVRRTLFELKKAEERIHLLEGFVKALDNLDAVIELIRASKDPETAKAGLVSTFDFSERQAQAILDLRLQRLTGMEREKILEEYREVQKEIERLKSILGSDKILMSVISEELVDIRTRYGDERRTEIVPHDGEISIEDLIADEDMMVTISREGYIKRMPVSVYAAQRRGGRGKKGMVPKEEDLVTNLFVASNHTNLLVFTNLGKAYSLKVYEVPAAGRNARGKPIVNLIPTEKGEAMRAVVPIREFKEDSTLIMVTRQGVVRRTQTTAFSKIRATGIIGIVLNEGDDLITVEEFQPNADVMIATRNGQSIRFPGDSLRILGRATMGVRGIRLEDDDVVVSATVISDPEKSVLTVTENGYGKRTEAAEYRQQGRAGKGIITIKANDRNGMVVGAVQVDDTDELMLITLSGIIIRMRVADIRVIGRNTQGVKLINLDKGDKVVAVERLVEKDEEDLPEDDGAESPAESSSRFHSDTTLRRDREGPADDEAEDEAEGEDKPEEE
jgi:DNA gyrase subunit A